MFTLSNKAFLDLTIHYVDQDWVLRWFLFNIIPFKTHHIGSNIADAISNILNEFNLSNKALALTMDNESVMVICGWKLVKEFKEALDNYYFKYYHYSAYILNLIVK